MKERIELLFYVLFDCIGKAKCQITHRDDNIALDGRVQFFRLKKVKKKIDVGFTKLA